jgi:hypothetical protein
MHARRRTLLFVPLVACAVAVPALAQQAPLTNYPACTSKPSAQDSEAAHSAFLLGQRFFNEADYGSALHNFVDAYKIDCTKTAVLIAIARANELSGNKAEAVHALETYLQRDATVGADEKAQIQKRIDNLKQQIAAAAAAAPPPVPVVVPVPPPTVTAPPPPPPPEPAHHTAGPWVVTGIGGATLIAGGVVWLIGHGKYTDAQNQCPDNMCKGPNASSLESQGDTGNTMMYAGGGMFIGGAALVAAGLIWHFVEPSGSSGEKKASVEPVLAPGYAGLSGRF